MNDSASKFKLISAFAAVYIIWGSTYLAILFAVETMPALLMAGVRFIFGGLIFLIWAAFKSETKISWRELGWTAFTGLLMVGVGGGAVHWAEKFVPSGLTALIVSAVPLYVVLIDWLMPGGVRPRWPVIVGAVAGFGGIFILIKPDSTIADPSTFIVGAIVIVVGSFAWSFGSVLSRSVAHPKSALMSSAVKLLTGGVALFMLGTISGEWSVVDYNAITMKSVLSLGYLITFGSLAFAAYNWLLHASTPTKASTYAYVNPVIAVILGAMLAGESFNSRIIIAAVVIVGSVFTIVNEKCRKAEAEALAEKTSPKTTLISRDPKPKVA